MTTTFTTDNIDRLQSIELDWPRGWKITFRSGNSGLHHQLYVNGQLADFSDTTEQRDFFVPADFTPRQIIIAAVDSLHRDVDMSDRLPASLRAPGWVYSASVVRSIAHRSGERLTLHTDRATGQLDQTPLLAREIWPAWTPRWAWGESPFGVGGFGFGGVGAPGLGKGAFGAGLFGVGSDTIAVRAPLNEEGQHQIVLRTVAQDGRSADAEVQEFSATPPPNPPASLTATQYDKETGTLTLAIEEE
ncbi:MAG: hypothetical protein ACYTF6_00060 [Planctomycetota bacterium]|jgi:hypothetical protein